MYIKRLFSAAHALCYVGIALELHFSCNSITRLRFCSAEYYISNVASEELEMFVAVDKLLAYLRVQNTVIGLKDSFSEA